MLAAALTLATVAGAAPEAKQRVRIDLRFDRGGLPSATFVLTPLEAGPIKRDWGRHYLITLPNSPRLYRSWVREGQWVFVGMHGTLVVRSRLKHFVNLDGGGAGGTWKVMDGTGQYAGVTGSGRVGIGHGTWQISGRPLIGRHEGFLALP